LSTDPVQPPHCHARARRVLAEVTAIRHELGRGADPRPAPEITGATPREVYFEALALWRKADRLAAEVGGGPAEPPRAAPLLTELRPAHVLGVLDAVVDRLAAIRARVGVTEAAPEPAIEAGRQPSDVLVTIVVAGRELSRALERPFTPADVYGQVTLASAYAARLVEARRLSAPPPAPFERARRPEDCYRRLQACLALATVQVRRAGHDALDARGALPDVLPGDVFDLASLVVGELAFLHALAPQAGAVAAFQPGPSGYRRPADVYQLAGTLEAQLTALAG